MTKLKIISTLLITFGIINIPVQAQNINDNQPDTFQSNEVNPLYGESGFNPLDLIHNANFCRNRTSADFAEDTNKNLDTAADDFKKQQLQRLIEMQQQNDTSVNGQSNDVITP